MMMIRRRTHNIYNLLESESEGEVDRLAVVEHWSLQARRQRTVTFFLSMLAFINNEEHGSNLQAVKGKERAIFTPFFEITKT